jgi:hypothetical protein
MRLTGFDFHAWRLSQGAVALHALRLRHDAVLRSATQD